MLEELHWGALNLQDWNLTDRLPEVENARQVFSLHSAQVMSMGLGLVFGLGAETLC
jgi:acyl carrier protein phosphodiesterase